MKSKKKSTSAFSIIINTVIYGVLIVALLFAVFVNINKKDNEITNFFGYSFAVIQSGSMTDGGFNIHDMVIIRTVNTDDLRAGDLTTPEDDGDIIVFYRYYTDNYPSDSIKIDITDQLDTFVEEENYQTLPENVSTKQDAINSGASLIFHRIISVKIDQYGTRFFETKGDSNRSADNLIREDFVCAIYVQSSPMISAVFNFIGTPFGLLTIIMVPIILMVFFQLLSFGKEIKSNVFAMKLLSRKIRYKDIDLEKVKLENILTEAEKVYLYDVALKEDKENLAIILWSEGVQESLDIYEKDREKYYQYWLNNFDKKEIEKLQFLKIKADLILKDKSSEENAEQKAKQIFKEKKKNGDFGSK